MPIARLAIISIAHWKRRKATSLLACNGFSRRLPIVLIDQIRWKTILQHCMKALGKSRADIQSDKKGASSKVMIAYFMKERTSVSNVWLAKRLNMGVSQGVSRSIGLFKRNQGPKRRQYKRMLQIDSAEKPHETPMSPPIPA